MVYPSAIKKRRTTWGALFFQGVEAPTGQASENTPEVIFYPWEYPKRARYMGCFRLLYSPTPDYVLRKRHTNEIRRRVLAVHCVFQPNTKSVCVCSLVSVIKMK